MVRTKNSGVFFSFFNVAPESGFSRAACTACLFVSSFALLNSKHNYNLQRKFLTLITFNGPQIVFIRL